MMRVLVAALLALVTVAGCISDDPADEPVDTPVGETTDDGLFVASALDANGYPVPALLCQPMLPGSEAWHAGSERCNFLMTPDDGREGNEVTIAVNPMDPRNVVGGAKDYYPPDAGECVWDGVYVTHDGGKTVYQDRSFEGSPWRLAAGDVDGFTPNYASQFWCTTDPVAYFDVNGKLYYLLMAYQADRVTGSKTCEEQCPNGALNDWAFNRAVQIVATSDNGGDSFQTFTPVLEGSFPATFHDKGWIAASPDGTIHVMWLAVLAPGNMYFRSTDGGNTFTDFEVLATIGQGSGQGSFLDVGTNDQVYALWTGGGSMQLRRSFDTGVTWDEARAIFPYNGGSHPGLSPRDRVTGYPSLATDRSPQSPFANAVYLAWQDACSNVTWSDGCESPTNGVYVAASFDEGGTFGAPVRVSGGSERHRVFPALSVSPGGVIDVSWMETTDKTYPAGTGSGGPYDEHAGYTQMYAYSLDGGATWSEPHEVRDAPDGGWDAVYCTHQNGMIFIGDYNDIDSSWQAAHPVWPDSRDGENCKVYTATIRRPVFANGWPQDDLLNALKIIRERPLT